MVSVSIAPKSPARLSWAQWRRALLSSVKDFYNGQAMDYAAALAYYGILSGLPALLVVVSLIGAVAREPQTTEVLVNIISHAGGGATEALRGPIRAIVETTEDSKHLLSVGIVVTLYTASRYVSAFLRAHAHIYNVEKTPPVWIAVPLHLAMTVVVVVFAAFALIAFALTGRIAEAVGTEVGFGAQTVELWHSVRTPILLLAIVLFVCGLYAVSPHPERRTFTWILPGSVVAVCVWTAASWGFGLYVRQFGSYATTYGGLGGVIIFLVWLWLGNSALLYGAELNAALLRERQVNSRMES